jgi:hypothetical protein
MGYGFYFIRDRLTGEERPAGYYVAATCDKRGCESEIDRGLGFCCGDPEDAGCGRYFCQHHLYLVGPNRGCNHRQRRPYGKTRACMVQDTDGVYCCYRTGHPSPHAWADPDNADPPRKVRTDERA